LLTGCRLGEIQTLQWSFVCLDERKLRLASHRHHEQPASPSVAETFSLRP